MVSKDKITDGQRKVIYMIENNLNIRFKGNTRDEARKFISDHIYQSKRASNEYMKNYRLLRLEEMQETDEYTEEDYYRDSWLQFH